MRATFIVQAAALAATTVYAQRAGSEDGPNNSTTPTDDEDGHVVHYVDVAKGGHYYQPNSIQADVGDVVSFRFYPTNHSVIRAEYGYPCIPYEYVVSDGEGFDSGFFASAAISDTPETWNLTINSTEPIFYYCGAPGSCDDWGMVGAINANGSTSVSRQIALANEADYVLLPGEPFPDERMSSASEIAQTATVETVIGAPTSDSADAESSDEAAAASHHSSGLSGGAIAGIVVGAVAAIAILAGLFFLLGRTKSMKKRLDEKDNNAQNAANAPQQPPTPSFAPAYFNPGTPHQSAQLPPYGQHYPPQDYNYFEHKPEEAESLAGGPGSPPLRGASPPPQHYSQGHLSQQFSQSHLSQQMSPPMGGFTNVEQQGRFGMTSELDGSEPTRAELYSPQKDTTANEGHPAYKGDA